MEISKKLEKKINTITQLNGERPKEIEITKEEHEQLGKIDKFIGIKLKIKE